MFDPKSENSDSWQDEIMNDVLDECRKHGGAYHVYLDKSSAGNVYVKCPTIAVASACVGALHGRWFSGAFHLRPVPFLMSFIRFFVSNSQAVS